MKRTLSILALAALGVSACNESPSASSGPPGSLSATYTGYISGSLNAEGAYKNKLGTTYALAVDVPDTQSGAFQIGAEEYKDRGGSALVMTLSQASAGEYSFNPGCNFDNARCAYGLFEYDIDVYDAGTAESYDVIGGTLTITAIDGERTRGTFSLQLQRFEPATGELIAGTRVTMSGGTFDVPIRRLN